MAHTQETGTVTITDDKTVAEKFNLEICFLVAEQIVNLLYLGVLFY